MAHHHILRRAAGAAFVAGIVAAGLAFAGSAGAENDGAEHASATLHDAAGVEVGFASFTEDATGTLHVNVKAEGLAPGLHGLHIHSVAACTSPSFASAGGHHNPGGGTHGSHAGDLPNLVVNAAGRGTLNATTDHATLSAGPVSVFDLDGSALVIHAGEDDLVTNPTGNSGPRIACGVIVAG